MKQKAKSAVKKAAKIAGVTCVALTGVALISSGAAVKAAVEGARYWKERSKDILARKEPETTE